MYQVSAGNNSTDLGNVGTAKTIAGAKRIGRKAVTDNLPNGNGNYKVIDSAGRIVLTEEKSIRTDYRWTEK